MPPTSSILYQEITIKQVNYKNSLNEYKVTYER